MNLDKIRRRDLQLIAYHEAGHLIALTKLGGYGYISIEEDPEADARELRLYSGRVHIRAQPTADRDRVLIGLAGLVAEELLDDPHADAWELVEYIESGSIAMSDTDAAMAKGFTADDVEQTIRLLSDHWPEVQQAAEWEISEMTL
jgi:Cft2 family RNA processing exonuclease